MSTDYKFAGWLADKPEDAKGTMQWKEYEPKTWQETDIDIKITHCGICGSDLHTLRSGWSPTLYPCCVGHEVVGEVVKVGSKVSHLKLGDRAGVGAQAGSCGECKECKSGNANYCTKIVGTYNGKYADGSKSYGGYADYTRVPAAFAVKIPDAIPSAEAAPMLCGGVTLYSPLKRYGAGPGKRVGIVGIGGLGHFGVLFAKALGCKDVVAISRSSSKKDDAFKMGATHFIATDEDKDWAKKNSRSLDLIVSTVSSPNLPLMGYLTLLDTFGQFIQVGVPEDPIPPFQAFALISKGVRIGGSAIGDPSEIKEMLDFAVEHKIKPWVEPRPLKDANQAIQDMDAGKAKYRYVLVNEKHS